MKINEIIGESVERGVAEGLGDWIFTKIDNFLDMPKVTSRQVSKLMKRSPPNLPDDVAEKLVARFMETEKAKRLAQQAAEANRTTVEKIVPYLTFITKEFVDRWKSIPQQDRQNALKNLVHNVGRFLMFVLEALVNSMLKKESVVEGKIRLSTDPNWYGAEVGDYKASGPVVNIPSNRLVGFEPDDKMNQPASKANVQKIVAGLKQGAKLPPLLVRQYKNGYQVLDGHHRFWAYKLLGVKSIPAQVVPAEDVEEVGQQGMAEGSLNEFAPGDGGADRTYEYEVYQCNPNDEFDWIGGPLHQSDDMGKVHGVAYEMWKKHPDKAFMIWQERSQGSRGGYGIKDDEQGLSEAELDEAKRKRRRKAKRRTSSSNRSPVPRYYGAWGWGGFGDEGDGGGE